MKIHDNFSDDLILLGQPVSMTIYPEKQEPQKFLINLPTIKQYLFDDEFQKFLSFINSTISDYNKVLNGIKFNSLYDMLIEFNKIISNEIFSTYRNLIKYGYSSLGINIDMYFEFFRIDGVIIDKEVFDRINYIILNCCCLRTEQECHMTEKELELQRKINKIKAQNNKGTNSNFTNCYIILKYEFKMSDEEILNLTMKKAQTLQRHGSGMMNYLINLIAAGNGLTKKIKHYTEKK